MDQRRETRLGVDTPVTVTVLGISGPTAMHGRILDVSGSGLRLSVPLPMPCGAPVKVEANETLMLGEVCRCEAAEDSYEAGLMIAHVLTDLADLRRLNGALLEQDPRQVQTEVPTRS